MSLRNLSQFDFHHTLATVPGTSLVMFGSPDCGGCRHLKQVLAVMAAEPGNDLALFEVDAQRDTALAREFEVFHLPSMFLFRDGHFHCQLHSTPVAAELRRQVAQALAKPAEEAP